MKEMRSIASFFLGNYCHVNRGTRQSGKKCLAVINRVKLPGILDGNRVCDMTDHQCLVYLDRFEDENSRLTRWSLALQPYNFIVIHKPGRFHLNAVYQDKHGVRSRRKTLSALHKEKEERVLVSPYPLTCRGSLTSSTAKLDLET